MSNPWPKQADARAFYGNPFDSKWYGNNIVYVVPPYPLHMGPAKISKIAVHKKCAQSLKAVLADIYKTYNDLYEGDYLTHMRNDGILEYDGSYNLRKTRGSQSISMHSYACALDFDAEHNPLGHPGRFTKDSIIVKAFKKEFWRWGGDYSGRKDMMHFEAVQ